jgi:NADH dehydrogenase (ubiquinone) 1 beta subcomplex subunit 9
MSSSHFVKPSFQVFYLYRRAIKELSNNLDRPTLSQEVRKVRKEFEEYRGETDQGKIKFLIERAHYWIDQVRHSEPYIIPDHPGGVAYLRNPEFDEDYIERHSSLTDHPEKYTH